jgi:DNA-binding HxlR family transcriptional regulator
VELDRIGTKCTSMVVKVLTEAGELRFTELRYRIPGPHLLGSALQSRVDNVIHT